MARHDRRLDREAINPDGRATDSRNFALFREDWPKCYLPQPEKLAEAAAIIQTAATEQGLHLSTSQIERVALWAIDLSNAYRKLGVQRLELWQQCFIWADGVRVDYRAVFGSAHLVGLFQRISSFVLAVAASRIEQYDAARRRTPTRPRSRHGKPTGRRTSRTQELTSP